MLERSQRVEIPVEGAFAFYGDAAQPRAADAALAALRSDDPGRAVLREGALLDYRLKLHGVPIRWQTLIKTWEPPDRFVDVQLKGPYSLWEHTHTFERAEDGATVIRDRVRYAIPFGPFGAIAHRLFVRRDLSGSSTTAATPSPPASPASPPPPELDAADADRFARWKPQAVNLSGPGSSAASR